MQYESKWNRSVFSFLLFVFILNSPEIASVLNQEWKWLEPDLDSLMMVVRLNFYMIVPQLIIDFGRILSLYCCRG